MPSFLPFDFPFSPFVIVGGVPTEGVGPFPDEGVTLGGVTTWGLGCGVGSAALGWSVSLALSGVCAVGGEEGPIGGLTRRCTGIVSLTFGGAWAALSLSIRSLSKRRSSRASRRSAEGNRCLDFERWRSDR